MTNLVPDRRPDAITAGSSSRPGPPLQAECRACGRSIDALTGCYGFAGDYCQDCLAEKARGVNNGR